MPTGTAAVRDALAGIGTTLDEDGTREELTRAAARYAGCAAALLTAPAESVARYEAVQGDADLLPEPRWVAAVAAQDVGQGRGWAGAAPGGRVRPALCVAVATGDARFGMLVCGRHAAPFTHPEAEFLALLAERAASHLRHAREYARISRIVGDLQRALLAEPGRPHPNLDVAIRYQPVGRRSLVGGDWCETVRLHFGRTLLVVGDVMGHGVEAAVDMTAYRQSLRYIASADLPPHRVLRQLDDIVSGEPDRRPATCLIARVDPARGQITLASAGHLPPAVIDAHGQTTLLPVPVGPPLGTGLGGYEAGTYRLGRGETLLLFTDGLVEHRGEDIDRSLDRLARLRFAGEPDVEAVLESVLTRLDARHAEDDVAVLAARLHPRADAPDDDPAARGPLGR
ncbi:PP2C family protein-serine/threonine phosphatase [Streptomyces sp. NPDC005017]|uniref:PP2C family protein-serine/threonine phosphatase n=1 Tax=Streptomyces sp. NPDC005017 TaxID=3364706 RepID=UPI0036C56503